jgi:hypothetical protein
MDTVRTVYEHKSTGLVLLGLGMVAFIAGMVLHLACHDLRGADLERLGELIAISALVRISHQVTVGHASLAYRYGRTRRPRLEPTLVDFPRREEADR